MTYKKKLKANAKFKKGQFVIYHKFGLYKTMSKIEDIKVKLNEVFYFISGQWIHESYHIKLATEEEVSKYIAQKLLK